MKLLVRRESEFYVFRSAYSGLSSRSLFLDSDLL